MFKPPLPFMGNKRNMIKNIKKALTHLQQEGYINSETIFIDAFGGSGLVSHSIKQWYPRNEVIWNDFDNYQDRLDNIQSTERLRQKMFNATLGIENRIKDQREILEIIKNHDGYIDYITISTWLLFSGSYVKDFKSLEKTTFYNRIPKAKVDGSGYLAGVKRVQQDFKELLDDYKEVKNKLLILDPPYLQTQSGVYAGSFGIGQFFELVRRVQKPYLFFGSSKSDIIESFEYFKEYHKELDDYTFNQGFLNIGKKKKTLFCILAEGAYLESHRIITYKDTTLLKTTYLDNLFLDEKYKEVLENLKETNPAYYKVYCLGEWGVLQGLVYEKYKIVDSMPKDLQLQVYGVDFGFNHPSALVLVGFSYDELFIKEVFYKTGFTSAKMIEHLKHNHNYITHLTGYFETAEPDKLQEFRDAGFIVQPAKKSIIDGINAVKKYRLNITKDSINLLKELQNYTWAKDKEGKSLDIPIDDYNHALDALRYAVYTSPKPTPPQSYLESYSNVEGAW